jgi:hypothetical protein
VVHVVSDVVGWLDRNRTVAEALGIGLAAVGVVMFATAIPAIIATTAAWGAQAIAAAMAATATLLAATPYILIAVAVAAVALGILELVKHWQDVTAFFSGAAKDVANFFEDDLVKPVGRFFTVDIPGFFEAGIHLFEAVWVDPQEDAIKDVIGFFENDLVHPVEQFFTSDIPKAFDAGYRFFESTFVDPVKNAIGDVEHGFEAAFNAIPGYVQDAFSGLVAIVKAPINGVIDIIDGAIGGLDSIHVSIPSWVPVVGGDTFGVSIPKIPQLAQGGLVLPQPGGTQVTVAEAGQAEIVSPIPAMEQAMTVALQSAGVGMQAGGADYPGSSAAHPLYAELELTVNGQMINRALVVFQQQGGQFTAARKAVLG